MLLLLLLQAEEVSAPHSEHQLIVRTRPGVVGVWGCVGCAGKAGRRRKGSSGGSTDRQPFPYEVCFTTIYREDRWKETRARSTGRRRGFSYTFTRMAGGRDHREIKSREKCKNSYMIWTHIHISCVWCAWCRHHKTYPNTETNWGSQR